MLIALSLVASGAMVFAILVLLGRYINYTLDLAGIAGLIIGIGMTADSFVVFFERIKDEIREGRSFRSAVPRGWARARKTILSGNAVTFLAAAVLYFLAVGQVKGFAFTLGLTTILDVVVVFLVTWPLVYLASKSPTMAKPSLNGLGAVQQIARERRAAASTRRDGDSDMASEHNHTEAESSDAVEAPDLEAAARTRRSTASSSGSTPAPAPSTSSASASSGTRSARVIVAVALASILLRGFTFGIDFEGGTKVSFPRGDGQATTQQVEDGLQRGARPGRPSRWSSSATAATATFQIRSETLTNDETEELRTALFDEFQPQGRRRSAEQAGHQRLGGLGDLGRPDHQEGAHRAGGVPGAGGHLHHRALRAVHGDRRAGDAGVRPAWSPPVCIPSSASRSRRPR